MTHSLHAGMHWQLRELLSAHNLSAYRLAQQLKGKMTAGSVYALARGETERVSLSTLGHLLGALEQLTGERYSVADLLAYEPPLDEEMALLEASAVTLGQELAQLEQDISPEALQQWLAQLEGKGA